MTELMGFETQRAILQEIENGLQAELLAGRGRAGWQGTGGVKSMPASTMELSKGMHDIRHQQSIPHSTGEGTVFQRLDRLAMERERLLKRTLLWAANLRRELEHIDQVDQEQEMLLRQVAPYIRAELEAVPR
ncbi:MAG: hypothetical protein ACE5IZ_01460 [Dehalococcoidia bacterium]